MAFAYRQSAYSEVGVDNVTLNSVQAGSLVVVFFHALYPGGGYGSVSCSDGSTLSACTDANGTYSFIKAFYHLSSGSGNKTYTITGEHDSYSVTAHEFSYSGTCELDVQNQGYGDATSPYATENITTTGTGSELVIAATCSYGAGANPTSPTINGTAADATAAMDVWSGAGLVLAAGDNLIKSCRYVM